jgi:hypothetical protein
LHSDTLNLCCSPDVKDKVSCPEKQKLN